jgi:4-hydroxy-3-polyprenylbenzoate decarboxylase
MKEFIKKIEEAGELLRIQCKVDTDTEIAEIADRMSKQAGGRESIVV